MAQREGELAPRPATARVYRNQAIAVHWNPERCIHSARCVAGLSAVFQPGERPWVKIDAASADEIARVITRCPTGALHYERLDGGPQETPEVDVTIAPQSNGPLYVRGHIRIIGADGALLREDTRVALCRCGQSGNKPFCDGSHRRVGFKAPA
jgi:uncharacterized Fe-S cluster protein YjdI/CDGSH-type Zn-finger protein